MNEHIYFFDKYCEDVTSYAERVKHSLSNPHVVALYPNGLFFGTHLSQLLNCPLSLIKIDKNKAEWVINLTKDKKGLFPQLIVAADLFDSEKNIFEYIKKLPEFELNPDYQNVCLYGYSGTKGISPLNQQVFERVIFPWQMKKEKENSLDVIPTL